VTSSIFLQVTHPHLQHSKSVLKAQWRFIPGTTRREHSHNLHTHPFNDPFSGTTQVSRYQKGKTNVDFTEATDSEWQWHQLGYMQVCTSLQTDNHASTPATTYNIYNYSISHYIIWHRDFYMASSCQLSLLSCLKFFFIPYACVYKYCRYSLLSK